MDILIKAIVQDEPILIVGLVNTETVERARLIHDTFPTASTALGRTMSGALLLSSLLKENQKVIVQILGDGPLKGVVAESDWLCRVRAYIKRPHIHMGLKGGKLDVGRGIGKGVLNVIKDLGLREYYQGGVPLQTGEIATDLAYYLNTSEQIPAAVSLGVYVDTDNSVKASGGFMIQALPGAGDETIGSLEKRMHGIRPVSSMVLEGLGPEQIMQEASGLQIKILEQKEILYYCPCTRERVLDAIAAIGKEEIEDMIRRDETVEVQCQFCKTWYAVPQEELATLLSTAVTADEMHNSNEKT